MKVRLGLRMIYFFAGLSVLSIFALVVIGESRNILVITEKNAVRVAVTYLVKKDITVNPANADVAFGRGKWNVFFFVTPDKRPAYIFVKVNPIGGDAEIIPLK